MDATLRDATQVAAEDAPKFCMEVLFEVTLLEWAYGLNKHSHVVLAEKVNGAETSWCLGAIMALMD